VREARSELGIRNARARLGLGFSGRPYFVEVEEMGRAEDADEARAEAGVKRLACFEASGDQVDVAGDFFVVRRAAKRTRDKVAEDATGVVKGSGFQVDVADQADVRLGWPLVVERTGDFDRAETDARIRLLRPPGDEGAKSQGEKLQGAVAVDL